MTQRFVSPFVWSGLLALTLFCVGCDGFSRLPPLEPKAEAAWEAYHDKPSRAGYMAFLKANGQAAAGHGEPHDGVGIHYQVRALEVQAKEAVLTKDADIAQLVVDRVNQIEEQDYFELYEETVSGSRARLTAARDKAAEVLD